MELCSVEATKYVWEGAIPLQIHLHESEVTTLLSPPPAMVLGPRIGYLPLVVPIIKPYFSRALPPGEGTVGFDYKGLPLKWYVPLGVLFDLLCVEPERPWNLTVHFRGYPGEILTPCEGEEAVKWSYINSHDIFYLQATYVINGNSKSIMNIPQADQFVLWQSLVKGDMDSNHRISSRLKLAPVGEDCILNRASSLQSWQATDEPEIVGYNRPSRLPVRLYVQYIDQNLDDLEDVPTLDNWDCVSYINGAVEVHKEGGNYLTLKHVMRYLLQKSLVKKVLQM